MDTLIKWINSVMGIELNENTFYDEIKDGGLLCDLINELIGSDVVEANHSSIKACVYDNFNNLLKTLKKIGKICFPWLLW